MLFAEEGYPLLFNPKSILYIPPAFGTYLIAAVLFSVFIAGISLLVFKRSPERRMRWVRMAGLLAGFAIALSCLATWRFMFNLGQAQKLDILPGKADLTRCYSLLGNWFLLSLIATASWALALRICRKALAVERRQESQ